MSLSLKETQVLQNIEEDHRKALKMLGTLYQYLKFITVHPSSTPDAKEVAERALELMEAEISE